MILQALCGFYDRLINDSSKQVALFGFSTENIDFVARLNKKGNLLDFVDLRELKDKKMVRKSIIVPKPPKKRTSGITSYFAWDKTDYVLGCTIDKDGNTIFKLDQFFEFKKQLGEICGDSKDEGIVALMRFAETWQTENAPMLPNWPEIAGKNVVFQLDGELGYIHDRPAAKEAWLTFLANSADDESKDAMCLVSGKFCPIANLHPPIFGVKDAHISGAGIVNFNKSSFTSYNKEQNLNAPVGIQPAFSYATALNHLLRRESKQKIQIADATTVYWTERDSPVESTFGFILDPSDTSGGDAQMAVYLDAIREGKLPPDIDGSMRFFILGLSANGPRLSIRFWYASTVKDISERIGQHFSDLAMIRSFDSDPEYPGMWHLLKETTNRKSSEGPPPLLAGAVVQAILNGTPYPRALLSAVIGRIRADQNLNYMRAAIIKAVLARNNRILGHGTEVPMALDKENKNIAYLLGRLFATLEKAQKDAIPGANATIKDRFYGSASSTPRVVFPQLLRLGQHHIEKAEFGWVRDKQIEEIIGSIREFPAHMSLDQQGLFAIGYYHQRQDFFTKKDNSKEEGAQQ